MSERFKGGYNSKRQAVSPGTGDFEAGIFYGSADMLPPGGETL